MKIEYDRSLYKERNQIERMFGHLKINRAIATRYDQASSPWSTSHQPNTGSNLSTPPSEAALREMFANLLVLVTEGATKDEIAEVLARWLPSGFAAIGPYLPDPGATELPATDVLPQLAAKADPKSPRP